MVLGGDYAMNPIKMPSGQEVLVDQDDFERLSGFRYYLHKKGYAYRFDYSVKPKKTIYLHHDVMGKREGFVVDHINHNKLDNRRENLRFATSLSNLHNSNKQKGVYSSKYKGACWIENDQAWLSTIQSDGKRIKLGLFTTEEAAANAFNEFVKNNRDEHAFLNDVPYDPEWRSKLISNRRDGIGNSKFIGVSWSSAMNKWQSHIMVNYKSIYLGCFENEVDAAKAYNEAASKYRGEKARLNQF